MSEIWVGEINPSICLQQAHQLWRLARWAFSTSYKTAAAEILTNNRKLGQCFGLCSGFLSLREYISEQPCRLIMVRCQYASDTWEPQEPPQAPRTSEWFPAGTNKLALPHVWCYTEWSGQKKKGNLVIWSTKWMVFVFSKAATTEICFGPMTPKAFWWVVPNYVHSML